MPNYRLRALDLFAGCGGLSLGLRRAGYSVLAAIEIDDLAGSTYRANHPDAMLIQRDIRSVSPSKLMKALGLKRGELDLLAGCPPCQGFSRIRTLNGATAGDQQQNNLVWVFLSFVKVFRPKSVMLENVPGLASDARLPRMMREFAKMGYSADWRILDAADFGVPQHRQRLVLLAARGFEVEFHPSTRRRRTVRDAIEAVSLPSRSTDNLHNYPQTRTSHVARIIRAIPRNGGSRRSLPSDLMLECHRRSDGFRDVYGRMHWDKPSPTITGGCINPSKGRFLHPSQHRAITLREAALLQGFPKSYRFELRRGRFAAAQLIGNAFPPQFAEHHARTLSRHIAALPDERRGK